jgi:hypothetical protein
MIWHRPVARALTGLVVVLTVVLAPIPAEAAFRRTVTASMSSASATLAAATTVVPTNAICGTFLVAAKIRVSWVATTSAFATGYLVVPIAAGVPQTAVVVAGGASTTVDLDVDRYTAYTVSVQATYRNWTSPATTSAASVTCGLLG